MREIGWMEIKRISGNRWEIKYKLKVFGWRERNRENMREVDRWVQIGEK